MRDFGNQPLSDSAAPVQARHIGLGPRLINKDEPSGINLALMPLPQRAATRDVVPVLLAGVQGFF